MVACYRQQSLIKRAQRQNVFKHVRNINIYNSSRESDSRVFQGQKEDIQSFDVREIEKRSCDSDEEMVPVY